MEKEYDIGKVASGGDIILTSKEATENKTYIAPENTAWDEVKVDVKPKLTTLGVVSNGNYTPPANYDGFSQVNVSVKQLTPEQVENVNKIPTIENNVNTNAQSITTLESKDTQIESKITTLENKDTQIESKITTLENKDTQIDKEINTLKSRFIYKHTIKGVDGSGSPYTAVVLSIDGTKITENTWYNLIFNERGFAKTILNIWWETDIFPGSYKGNASINCSSEDIIGVSTSPDTIYFTSLEETTITEDIVE